METYNAKIVKLEAVRLYGRRISTSYAAASQDCSALWYSFASEVKLDELCQAGAVDQSYGISIMTGPENFDYMAAIELAQGEVVPHGMQEFTLAAGPYVKCHCASLEQIGEVYTFMYQSLWVPENSDYAIDFSKPCFEGYTGEYLKTGALDVYAPLKAK